MSTQQCSNLRARLRADYARMLEPRERARVMSSVQFFYLEHDGATEVIVYVGIRKGAPHAWRDG